VKNKAQKGAVMLRPRVRPFPVSRPGRFRFADFFILLLCISGAAFSFNLFRLDLFSTITEHNEEPVGIIIARNNIVQRRLAERVLWGRLEVESPVFLGDLIRVAGLSSAALNIEGTYINLNENTLIRIQRTPGEELPFLIALDEGSLSLSTEAGAGGIILNLNGRHVEARPGTVLTAAAGSDGIVLTVNEGTALFIDREEGEIRDIRYVPQGAMLSLDAEGAERTEAAAVVTSPPPNARFVAHTLEPFPVNFVWNRLRLQPQELLRLEFAADRNFTRITGVIDGLYNSTRTTLDAGVWHWRLLFEDSVLSTGQLTVTGTARPDLISPVTGSIFRFHNDVPAIRFQWSEIEGAEFYIFEASRAPDFSEPRITRQSGAAFLVDSTLEPGTWHWRVLPVFPPIYEGDTTFSPAAFFHIEQVLETAVPAPGEEHEQEQEHRPVLIQLPQPIAISLSAPAQGAALTAPPGLTALPQALFTWASDAEAAQSRFVLSRNSDPLGGTPAVEILNPADGTVRLDNLEQGRWYWTVEARAANGLISAAEIRYVQIQLSPIETHLLAPAQGAAVPGLTALRQQTVFTWASDGGETQSRFILSRNSNPLAGTPAVVIPNPQGQSAGVNRLEQGRWYWTVETHAPNGLVSTAPPRHLQVLPIPLLAAPGNRLPAAGHRIGIPQLRTARSIAFSWSPVPGANAYIFALYQQTPGGGRRLIQRNAPGNLTAWTLNDISVLDRGTFIWQVEAVNRGVNNVIEQRGVAAENTFVIDFPLPGPVLIEDPGILYGR